MVTCSILGRLASPVNEIEASGRLEARERLSGATFRDMHNKYSNRPLSAHYRGIIGRLLKRAKTALFSLPRFWGEKIKGGKKYEN